MTTTTTHPLVPKWAWLATMMALVVFAVLAAKKSSGAAQSQPSGLAPTNTPAVQPGTNQTPSALDALIERERNAGFRSSAYLAMAAALQSLPPDVAAEKLRAWAKSGNYERPVLILAWMLFEGKPGTTLRHPPMDPYDSVDITTSFAQTTNADWPSWPLAFIEGVPFLINSSPAAISVVPEQPGLETKSTTYLDYCLATGQWASRRYTVASQPVLLKALEEMLHSSTWKEPLDDLEIKYLSYQIIDDPKMASPPVPLALPPANMRRSKQT